MRVDPQACLSSHEGFLDATALVHLLRHTTHGRGLACSHFRNPAFPRPSPSFTPREETRYVFLKVSSTPLPGPRMLVMSSVPILLKFRSFLHLGQLFKVINLKHNVEAEPPLTQLSWFNRCLSSCYT